MHVLSNSEILPAICGVIDRAKEWVALVSPYANLSRMDHVCRAMIGARQRGIFATLAIRENEKRKAPDEEALARLVAAGIPVYLVPNLHAKIYASEREAVVTSLNLYDYSVGSSIEIGMHLTDPTQCAPVQAFIGTQIAPHKNPWRSSFAPPPSTFVPPPSTFVPPPSPFAPPSHVPVAHFLGEVAKVIHRATLVEETGHCIRCAEVIPRDPSRPYCKKDYAAWARYEDRDYRDLYCHACGRDYAATMNRPLCRSCYRSEG